MYKFEEDVEEVLDRCNKRLAIVTIIWCLITIPIIFFISKENLIIFTFFWLIWVLVGIRLSPWIAGKIWKD